MYLNVSLCHKMPLQTSMNTIIINVVYFWRLFVIQCKCMSIEHQESPIVLYLWHIFCLNFSYVFSPSYIFNDILKWHNFELFMTCWERHKWPRFGALRWGGESTPWCLQPHAPDPRGNFQYEQKTKKNSNVSNVPQRM